MNGSYRALLISVPTYRDPLIEDLPFVTDDTAELAEALGGIGYDVRIHDVDETDRESIDYAIEAFFQGASPGETLLLYLSGHGVHHGGKDYLVPKGARTASHDFRGKCLSLDFSSYVERSEAGDVVVFVDACREGIDLMQMSVGNAVGWSDMRVTRVGERHYCHVYACSPGERARYTRAGNSTFSIFSRALSTVVADEAGPSTLRDLKEQLQSATDALTAEHKLFRQQIRVRTEKETDDFVVFERPDRTTHGAGGEHAWVTAARNHPAWKQIGDVPSTEAMRTATVALVAQIAPQSLRDEARLTEDPWRPADFAERMTGGVGWLLSKVLNPEKLALSPAEAALLVAVPYLYVSCANRAAAQALEAQPTNLGRVPCATPARANYEQFLNNQQRLVRRAALEVQSPGGRDRAADIAWWLFRRWLTRKPGGFQEEILDGLLGPVESLLEDIPADADRKLVTELFELNTLSMLLRSLRTSYDTTTIRPKRQLAGGAEAEQHIREQLLVALLTVAHHLAIDPVLLPDVIAEHLGISYSVDMKELHQTIQTARWDQHGRTRVLNAACHHPAVGLALRQQAAALDSLFGAVDVQASSEPQLEPLQDLPAHATANQVRPAVDAAGTPAYESTDLRFRLADDRIQELLMGEQLYGDPALAIRELYQNALDACRYRGARTQYLRRRHPELATWSGRITFKQDVDEHGRAYIECTDNGIGMGQRELREVFSHAGMRFADLPEYLDEHAEWREVGIELHANSRFGIGVLSYFMIADDISVTTCRLDREGHPGRRLRVDIAGPGSLFYIRDLGRGHEAGTTVRMYLRPSAELPSCTDLLRRLLWISEYSVTAQDLEARFEWKPDVLSSVAPLAAAQDPHASNAVRAANVTVDATTRPDVWWTNGSGGILADGLWIGVPLYGAVVNLTGEYVPQLTVDRRRALAYDKVRVTQRLREEIPTLLREDTKVFSHSWLSELVSHYPALADEIAEAAVTGRYSPWVAGGQELDITAAGCFPMDKTLMQGDIWFDRPAVTIPELVLTWRVKSWVAAGAFPEVGLTDLDSVVRARPTDIGLLIESPTEEDLRGKFSWERHYGVGLIDPELPVPLGHVLQFAYMVGRSPQEAADRLTELGLRLQDGVVLPETVTTDELLILSCDLDQQPPWLDVADPVSLGHVLMAAERTKRRPAEVAARLAELGLRLVEGTVLPESTDPTDSYLLGRGRLRGPSPRPWLDVTEPVPLGHVLAVAQRTKRRPAEVVARLTELGLRLQGGAVQPAVVNPDDLIILRHRVKQPMLWWDVTRSVPPAHVLVAAHAVGRSPEEVAARLVQLGLRLHEAAELPSAVDPGDLTLLNAGIDRTPEWLNFSEPVPLGHVLAVAERTKRRPAEVADRLTELGLRLPEGTVLPEVIEFDDLFILSKEQDRLTPWLDAADPVPLGHVLAVAERTKRRPAEVADRLMDLGLRLTEGTTLPESVEVDDATILSMDVDRAAPWLDKAAPVALSHVLRAAVELGRRPAEVAARIVALGFQVADGPVQLENIKLEDLRMFADRDRRGEYEWLDKNAPVGLSRVFQGAVLSGRPLSEVVHRFRDFGFALTDDVIYAAD
ncbi:caspase family protein [Streptomyces sp. NBC_00569]|uniref:wHTH domain-containing protein n=1 Tax=Streptomyces sp. NBC_00569 TaxID=2975780 RepID=UPI002E80FB9B|nr:caspase family protein [Streptomyces sp. NBC_00569]WUB96948.1 caspase family protein [Streptomyces sp. NBC_00569]